MRRELFFALALALLALGGCSKNASSSSKAPQPPPMDVAVATVIQRDVPIRGTWVATLDGYVNASIQPQVSGYVIRQDYREGSFVHKGDVLFEIDPRPFEAVLNQTKGQLAQSKGQLAQATAQLGLTNINVKRDTPLAAAHAIAQSQLDNDIQAKAAAEATVQADQAAIQSSQASVQAAALNVGFTKVRSLIDGIAGLATIQIGNLVTTSTVLTTVSKVDPIKVYFPISEQEYLRMSAKLNSGPKVDLLRRSEAFPLQLTLADGSVWPHKGHIVFVNRQVDPQTGTIRIVGAFANPGNVLRPGQFGNISTVTSIQKDALLIPQSAVSQLQGTYQVAVVGAGNKVNVRDVKVGDRVGELWMIDSGLNAGDRVVSQGVSKVKDGMIVNPTSGGNSQANGQ